MTHAPKFWAEKLPKDLKGAFWALINFGFSGETAYCRVLEYGNDTFREFNETS